MRILLVNLPYRKRIMRRYVASYFAPNFLLPPLELMSLGALARRRGHEVTLVDAIAEGRSEESVREVIREAAPDLLVTITGYNIFPADMATLGRLQEALPEGARTVLFGYLPTVFPREVLAGSRVDFVLSNEPETPFDALIQALEAGGDGRGLPGVWTRNDTAGDSAGERAGDTAGAVAERAPIAPRIEQLDELPFPDYSLIDLDLYNEAFLERPFAALLSERGCPYGCTFCVRTYGRQLVSRSAENVLAEIRELKERFGIRHFRFLDDTITIHRERMHEICRTMLEEGMDLHWTCFTRLDRVDTYTLNLMKEAGCRRVYVGIESGAEKNLDLYKKGLDLETIERGVRTIQNVGIDISAFFIVGAPGETLEDVDQSADLAIRLGLDYVIVTKLQYWPGTPLFDRNPIEFDLFADRDTLYRNDNLAHAHALQKRFYRRFYLRPGYVRKRIRTLLQSPLDTVTGFFQLLRYLYVQQGFDDLI